MLTDIGGTYIAKGGTSWDVPIRKGKGANNFFSDQGNCQSRGKCSLNKKSVWLDKLFSAS